jgi:two-component system, LytTR family, response regulator
MIRAIIIDDEQSGINSLRLHLERFTADVKVVASSTDPAQGIGLIEDFRPEIVFLDINMPGLNGFELLAKLKYRKFHLIFTTAHDEYGLQAIKENALDYLLKPIDKQDLLEAIAKAKMRE